MDGGDPFRAPGTDEPIGEEPTPAYDDDALYRAFVLCRAGWIAPLVVILLLQFAGDGWILIGMGAVLGLVALAAVGAGIHGLRVHRHSGDTQVRNAALAACIIGGCTILAFVGALVG